jgi:hypothetical protein
MIFCMTRQTAGAVPAQPENEAGECATGVLRLAARGFMKAGTKQRLPGFFFE